MPPPPGEARLRGVLRGMDLKNFVCAVPDFPEAGVLFRDITPLLHEPRTYEQALSALCGYVDDFTPDIVVAIESRGFIFSAPVAARLGLPLVPVRKPGMLPAARMSVEYSLEYGASQLDIHADAINPGQRAASPRLAACSALFTFKPGTSYLAASSSSQVSATMIASS